METFSRETLQDNSLNPWYITGFVEGEGSFTYSRNGNSMGLYFAIKLTREDLPLLEMIQNYFGVGKIYSVKPRHPDKSSGYTKSSSYFRVNRRDDLEIIIRHFDKYPLSGAKRESYLVWKEMVKSKRRFRRPDTEELNKLARELSGLAPRKKLWDGDE